MKNAQTACGSRSCTGTARRCFNQIIRQSRPSRLSDGGVVAEEHVLMFLIISGKILTLSTLCCLVTHVAAATEDYCCTYLYIGTANCWRLGMSTAGTCRLYSRRPVRSDLQAPGRIHPSGA